MNDIDIEQILVEECKEATKILVQLPPLSEWCFEEVAKAAYWESRRTFATELLTILREEEK